MWPFSSRSARSEAFAPQPKDLPAAAEFELDDAVLKLWLPPVLSERINWLSNQSGSSRPDVLRALLYEHLYGKVAYEALKIAARAKQMAEERIKTSSKPKDLSADRAIFTALHATHPGGDIQRSRSRETTVDLQYLGKASDDFKLHLPARLKKDLALVARQQGLTASSYARKLLVQKLLGDGFHTDWQKAIGKISREIEQLERDD